MKMETRKMTFGLALVLILMGFGIGTLSGMVGIGGGLLIIPLLMSFFAFSQQKATGTSLAMLLPPIGIFAVMAYSKTGNIDWGFAGLLALGFTFGGYAGAWLVNKGLIHPTALRIALALFLVYVAFNMLFRTGGRARSALESLLMVIGFAGVYVAMRLLGRKWMKTPCWGETYRSKLRHTVTVDYEI
jgi:uncharacterized protein